MRNNMIILSRAVQIFVVALIVTLPAASYLFAEGRQLAQRSVSGGSDRPGIQIAALIDGKEAEASVPDDTSNY